VEKKQYAGTNLWGKQKNGSLDQGNRDKRDHACLRHVERAYHGESTNELQLVHYILCLFARRLNAQ
jgi:hypothetical protein